MPNKRTNSDSIRFKRLGHYEVERKIGQGGMAEVFLGVQASLNRKVAIKVLPLQFAQSEELVARFNREAQIAAQLNHPNIVQIIDRGKDGDTLFIVMEYVEGDSLDKLIEKGKLTLGKIVTYANQICDALDYAHKKGVIHRDLKPSNILIDKTDDRAKISDFGIAQLSVATAGMSTLTTNNAALGTINYMSPEQRTDSHNVTHLTDIFSFGVMLYQMLTGKLPLGHFKMPSHLNPNIPIGFDNIIKKCLETNPEDRFQSAEELRNAINGITGWQAKYKDIALKMGDSVRQLTNSSPSWLAGKLSFIIAGAILVVVAAAILLLKPATPTEVANTSPETRQAAPPPASEAQGVPESSGANVETPRKTPPVKAKPTLTREQKAAIRKRKMEERRKKEAKALDTNLRSRIDAAAKYAKGGELDKAIETYHAVITDHPEHPRAAEARFRLGTLYEEHHNFSAALNEYKLLAKTYPRSPFTPRGLLREGNIYKNLAATDQKSDEGNFQRAKDTYDVIIVNYPDSAQAPAAILARCAMVWDREGTRLLFIKQYDADVQKILIRDLKTIVNKYPGSPEVKEALRLIARIARKPRLKDYTTSGNARMTLYEKGWDASSGNLEKAAEMFRKAGDEQLELKALRRFIKDFPNDKHIPEVKKRVQELQSGRSG